jgi:tRNA U34 5-carboxymethylaminomethyl modifying GTPase MnmE/TrmE
LNALLNEERAIVSRLRNNPWHHWRRIGHRNRISIHDTAGIRETKMW